MQLPVIDALISKGKFEEARSHIRLQCGEGSSLSQAILYGRMGRSFTAQWRFADAIPWFERSIQSINAGRNRGGEWRPHKISVCIEFCYALHATRRYEQFSEIVGELKPDVEIYGNANQRNQYLKVVYMDILNRHRWYMLPDEALVVCNRMIELARDEGDIKSEIDGLNNLSFTYMLNHQTDLCRKYALRALAKLKEHHDDEGKSMAHCYMMESYRLDGNVEDAVKWHHSVRQQVKQNNNPTSKVLADAVLAWIHYKRADFELSEETGREVFLYMTGNRFPFLPVCSLLLLALYLRKKDLSACSQQAFILLHPNIQHSPVEITGLLKAGLSAYARYETTRAGKHYLEAIEIADRKGYL